MYHKTQLKNFGFAALTATILTMIVSLTIIGGLTLFAFREVNITRNFIKSTDAHYAAEGGIEDALYRVLAQKQIGASETLAVGNGTTTITVTSTGNTRTIRSEGRRATDQKNLEITLQTDSNSVNFHYGVQVDAGGVTMGNGAQINGNIFSNGSINGGKVTGNATVATGLTSTPTVEWPVGCASTCGDSDNMFATTTTNQDIAQSFTATASGPLNKVSIFLGKNGTPTADLTLLITADNSNHPATSQLANGSTAILRSSVGNTPSWIDVTFATPPNLTSGTKYWIILDYNTNSTTNYWNWRKDSTDSYGSNTGKKTTDWSSGSAVWANVGGDLAFRLWIGGINNQISNIAVDDMARAPAFVSVTAGGSPCPNVNCIVAQDPPQSLPISDGIIQDWRDEAAVGGPINGNYTVSGLKSLGPIKINGNLEVSGGSTLTVTGTIWVTGTFETENDSAVKLDSGYSANSGVIIADDVVDISNNTTISGSGQAGSYLMVIGAKNAPASQVMDISNNSLGAIYYANHGRIHFNNNAGAKEVTAYGFDLDNNASVTYEAGLQNTNFSSGPSGGYTIKSWKEVE